jgi:drug/metabolite transporter (DMT)-like permease
LDEIEPQVRWQALGALLFGAVVIGLAPILARLTETGPAMAGFWRLLLALPLLALIARRGGEGLGRPSRLVVLAGVMFALDIGFWHYGLAYTSVAKATVLTNLTPVVVTLFAWIFLRQRPRALFVAAVALAVAGAATLALDKGGTPGRNPALGDALSLATALWYALYFLAVGEARKRDGATRVMFWSTLTGVPLLLAAGLALGEDLISEGAAGWAACAGLGLVHVAGQGSIAWALGRLPTATASVVVLIQPVIAALLGWMLFAETLGPWQAVGAAVALTGVLLAQHASRKAAQPDSP